MLLPDLDLWPFPSPFLCLHWCGWSDTARSGLVRIHCLPLCSTKQTIRLDCGNSETQTERQTQKNTLTVSYLVPAPLSVCRVRRQCLSRSPAECLCNWTLRWSSSNHVRIIKTCWSLQSWERGRFINDTLTTAVDCVRSWEMVILLEIIGWIVIYLQARASASGLSCKWICLENERNERQREEREIELIASGHGDNDFFMDLVGVKWPGYPVCFVFFIFLKGGKNVRVNITMNRGIYWICKCIWFYDRVYMPITLPNDPLCIHAMQICHRIVRSRWLSGAPICWTREHIICSWYQNIMTRWGGEKVFSHI